jgi:hypothetical protein
MKNLRNIAAAILMMVLLMNSAVAQTVTKADAFSTPEPFTVKYLGTQNDFLVFQVEVNTGDNGFNIIKINDREEGELYSQPLKAAVKMQTFKIEKKNYQELSFKLLSGKKLYSKSFSTNTSVIETVTVNENDTVQL